MWGANRRLDAPKDTTVKDEDLQAQAWLPNCLMVMLSEVRACTAFQTVNLGTQDSPSNRADRALFS